MSLGYKFEKNYYNNGFITIMFFYNNGYYNKGWADHNCNKVATTTAKKIVVISL